MQIVIDGELVLVGTAENPQRRPARVEAVASVRSLPGL
jgi:hypothetical protein